MTEKEENFINLDKSVKSRVTMGDGYVHDVHGRALVERRWRPLILASTRAILDPVVNSAKSIGAAEDDSVLRHRRSRFANEDRGSASASLRRLPRRRARTTPSTRARTSSTTATPIPPPPSPTSSAAPMPTPPGSSTSTRSTNRPWRSSRRYMGAEQWRWGRASYTHGTCLMKFLDSNLRPHNSDARDAMGELWHVVHEGGGANEEFNELSSFVGVSADVLRRHSEAFGIYSCTQSRETLVFWLLILSPQGPARLLKLPESYWSSGEGCLGRPWSYCRRVKKVFGKCFAALTQQVAGWRFAKPLCIGDIYKSVCYREKGIHLGSKPSSEPTDVLQASTLKNSDELVKMLKVLSDTFSNLSKDVVMTNILVNDMAKELDILLSSIEQEGGFWDACTVLQQTSVMTLEEGLQKLSAISWICKVAWTSLKSQMAFVK
uniref:Uncharacterized protein n=1 Tax=Ananas comosus var. bracteatus TaxID=296719 RepID=A0A6V7NXB4_ANACO|nr:unnamed protein product [Ananas comosus var. bracteatus]